MDEGESVAFGVVVGEFMKRRRRIWRMREEWMGELDWR